MHNPSDKKSAIGRVYSDSLWKLELPALKVSAEQFDPGVLGATKPGLAHQSVYQQFWKKFTEAVDGERLPQAQENLAHLESMVARAGDKAKALQADCKNLLKGDVVALDLSQSEKGDYLTAAQALAEALETWDLENAELLQIQLTELRRLSLVNRDKRKQWADNLERGWKWVAEVEQLASKGMAKATDLENCKKLYEAVLQLTGDSDWLGAKEMFDTLSDLYQQAKNPAAEDTAVDDRTEPATAHASLDGVGDVDTDSTDTRSESDDDEWPTAKLDTLLQANVGTGPCLQLKVPELKNRPDIDNFKFEIAQSFQNDCASLPTLSGVQIGGLSFECCKPVLALHSPKLEEATRLDKAAGVIRQTQNSGWQFSNGLFAFHVAVTVKVAMPNTDPTGWRVRVIQNSVCSLREVVYADGSRMFIKVDFACQDIVGEAQPFELNKPVMLRIEDAPKWQWVDKLNTPVASVTIIDPFRVFVLVTTPANEDHCLMYMDWKFEANKDSASYTLGELKECDGTSSCDAVTTGAKINLIDPVFQPATKRI